MLNGVDCDNCDDCNQLTQMSQILSIGWINNMQFDWPISFQFIRYE